MRMEKKTETIFLCGMMGSGKSSVGRLLARKLGRPFFDLDREIERSESQTITAIFEKRGEEAFRQIERRLLEEISGRHGGVVALGGGALGDQEAVDLVKGCGKLIFLEAPLSVILERLQGDRERPLLLSGDETVIRERIEGLLKEREPFYRQAHLTVDTGRLSPGAIADRIIHVTRS